MGKELMLADFLEEITDEPIEKAVLYYYSHYEEDRLRCTYKEVLSHFRIPFIPSNKLNTVLNWEEAREFLNFPMSYRHGTLSYCEFMGPIWFVCWTSEKIIFPTHRFNGIQIVRLSRNPNGDFLDCPLTADTHDGRKE